MKKLISLFLSLCMALTMVSALAEAPAAQPFLGDWTIVTVTADGAEANYPSLGINFSYAFNEDGTVVLFIDGEAMDSALWEEKDGALTLIASEDRFDMTLEDNKLYMTNGDAVMMLMRPQDMPEQPVAQIPSFDMNELAALFSGEGQDGGEEDGLGAMLGGLLGGLFSSEGEDAENVSYLPSTVVAAESKEQFFGVWQLTSILIGSDKEPILSLNMQDLTESNDPAELRFTISDGVFTHLENGEEKPESYAMELVDGALALTGEEDAMQLYLTDAGEIVINVGILNIFLSPVVEEAETPAA